MRSSGLAGLSVDVDSVSTHLEGYGFARPKDDGGAYRRAIPRFLDLLDASGARATFFLIAEEAARHPDAVEEIVARGHEVASHSMSHRLPFSDLSARELEVEVAESRTLLRELTGTRIDGFRAPSWDLSEPLLEAVRDAGYRYDASTYPSLLLPLLRLSVARRSDEGRSRAAAGLMDGVFGPTRPHETEAGDPPLVEIPICTAPFTRLPYYHTLRFLLPPPVFGVLKHLAHRRRGPVTYQFHAVDFMGVEEDGLDPRIERHPGMDRTLDDKLELAARALADLAEDRDVVPLAGITDELFGPRAAVESSTDSPRPLTRPEETTNPTTTRVS